MTKYLLAILLVLLGLELLVVQLTFVDEQPVITLTFSSLEEGSQKQTEQSTLNGESQDEEPSYYLLYMGGINRWCVLLGSFLCNHPAQGFVDKPFTPPNTF